MKQNSEQERKGTFVKLDDEIADSILEVTQDSQCLIVYYMLLRHRNRTRNTCFPSANRLARELHISASTVKRRIKVLYENGFIDINSGTKGIANSYYFPLESFYQEFQDDMNQCMAYKRRSTKFKSGSKKQEESEFDIYDYIPDDSNYGSSSSNADDDLLFDKALGF